MAQLLALNALFDAARQGESARETARTIQAEVTALNDAPKDSARDSYLDSCYVALMENAERLPRLS